MISHQNYHDQDNTQLKAQDKTPQKIITVEALSVHAHGGQTLVEPISFDLHKGQNLTILGETGSGKSLLAEAIMGALPDALYSTGKVLIENQHLTKAQLREQWGRSIAMLPQEPSQSLDPTMTIGTQVWESLYFVAKKDKTTSRQITKNTLKKLGLSDFDDYYPHELSGGMAQRASFAAATVGGAHVLIADEPTKGLDDANKQVVIDLLRQVSDDGGTLLTITHDIDVAQALGHRPEDVIMVMKKGELLEKGTAAQVLNAPKSDYTKQLIDAAPKHWPSRPKTEPDGSPLLSVQGLALRRGHRILCQNLNFELKQGEILGVVGQSGIGKSSLGDALCGLLKPHSGDIKWHTKPKRHEVLKLYQDPPSAFSPHVSLRTLLDDIIKKHGLDGDRLPMLLEQLKLDPAILSRNALNVSGGELQRIAILRALLLKPKLLFADEVTSRLDPITQQQTLDLLVSQCQAENCALIIVSHDHDLIRYHCHQVIEMQAFACSDCDH